MKIHDQTLSSLDPLMNGKQFQTNLSQNVWDIPAVNWLECSTYVRISSKNNVFCDALSRVAETIWRRWELPCTLSIKPEWNKILDPDYFLPFRESY